MNVLQYLPPARYDTNEAGGGGTVSFAVQHFESAG